MLSSRSGGAGRSSRGWWKHTIGKLTKCKSFLPRASWKDGVQERVRVRVQKLWDHVLWRKLTYLQLPGWRGYEGRGTAVTLLDVRDVPL